MRRPYRLCTLWIMEIGDLAALAAFALVVIAAAALVLLVRDRLTGSHSKGSGVRGGMVANW